MMKIVTVLWVAAVLPLLAQDVKLPANLDRLAEKAQDAVVVTLDKPMLQLAARFLSDRDGDMKKAIAGLEGIYVHSYEFEHEGEFTRADTDGIRSQLQTPAWSHIAGVKSHHGHEDVDVYMKDVANGQTGGIVVIAAEPRELTIVNIVGKLDLDKLIGLGGEFGIPDLEGALGRGDR